MARKFDPEKHVSVIRTLGGELESSPGATSLDRILVRCRHGHVFPTQPYRLTKPNPTWCPYCARKVSEVDHERGVKRCSQCREWKPFESFTKDKRKKLGITANCTACRVDSTKRWSKANPDKVKALRMTSSEAREYRLKNLEKSKQYSKKWRESNREHIALKARTRRSENPQARILQSLRGRLNHAVRLQGIRKCEGTLALLGCNAVQLRSHLESLFQPGMSFENHGKGPGKWHIDHIIPCATFDLTDVEQQRKCFHFTNLRPLWEAQNLSMAWDARVASGKRKATGSQRHG